MTTALEFEHISKRYRLGEVSTGTISRDLERVWARFRGMPDPHAAVGEINNRAVASGDFIYALKNVDFSVEQGEVVGLIGRNGSGKSTLLKLLSRITSPSAGHIRVRGRVASLLEVGTGFHPELTGRENVYLNGAILGMSRAEIRQRFDEIIDFSGCEKFIDTPVKRYSSGMQVRLGFAVAAHLDSEILVVDEVLAVGDAEFQMRCTNRLQELATQDGRAVLFVSHNMASISRLCSSGLLLDEGTTVARDTIENVVAEYGRRTLARSRQPLAEREDRLGSGRVRVIDINFHSNDGDILRSGSCIQLFVTLGLDAEALIDVDIYLRDISGIVVAHLTWSTVTGHALRLTAKGNHRVCFTMPRFPLVEGTYTTSVYITADGDRADWVQEACELNVEAGDFFDTGRYKQHHETRVLISYSAKLDAP